LRGGVSDEGSRASGNFGTAGETGSAAKEVEGEDALDTLVSRDAVARLGLADASYGLARFLPVEEGSFLRFDGARTSTGDSSGNWVTLDQL